MFNDAVELEMFDMTAHDMARLVDIPARLYKKRKGASVDPVHGDFRQELYTGPFEIVANAEEGFAKTLTVDAESGFEATRESEIWVTRKETERVDYGFIETGDVISFLLERRPTPYYFFVQNAHDEGRLPQGRAFVMWRLEIRFMSKFDPEDAVEAEEGEPCITDDGWRID